MAWGADILRVKRTARYHLHWLDTIVRRFAEDAFKISEEHRKHRRRNVQCRGKNNADVPNSHLVDIGIVDDHDQVL